MKPCQQSMQPVHDLPLESVSPLPRNPVLRPRRPKMVHLMLYHAGAQEALEEKLSEEEKRRNSRRMDLLYMLSSHPVAPDAYEVAEQIGDSPSKPLDAASVGELLVLARSGPSTLTPCCPPSHLWLLASEPELCAPCPGLQHQPDVRRCEADTHYGNSLSRPLDS